MKFVKSPVIPLKMADIDTDMIIPARHLTTTKKTGLGKYLFEQIREANPLLSFNQPCYQEAKILVSGRNFGCGSSREHAVWALSDWGIQIVLASSFADIFYNNAFKNQLLPVVLPEEVIQKIFDEERGGGKYELTVDIEAQKVTLPDGSGSFFELDPYRKECLVREMDDLDYLLSRLSKIRKFKEEQVCYYDVDAISTQERR